MSTTRNQGEPPRSIRQVAGAPPLLRRLNSALVLRTVRAHGPVSRSEIARSTGLSKPTVNQVVELLLQEGYIVQGPEHVRPAHPGRRPRLLSFRADRGYLLGIDIGADKILILLADLSGRVLASERCKTGRPEGASALIDEVLGAVTKALTDAGVSQEKLRAVGVGTPGVVDPTSGSVTLAPQLVGWEGVQLGKQLGAIFPCPVVVDNEAHLSLLAERRFGVARGIDDVVFIHIGVGIGAGILIHGQLYRGASGAAGEIGYLPIPDCTGTSPEGLGPFEEAAGGQAYARLGSRVAASDGGELLRRLAHGDPLAVDAQMVFAAASQGDQAAAGIVDELVRRLAYGVAAVVVTLNPAAVVIGGGVSRAGQALLAPLDARVRALVPVPPQFLLSSLSDEAVAMGAIQLAMQNADERLFHTLSAPLL